MYKLKFHKNLDIKKWNKFSKSQQILMIANELNRAKNWIIKGDLDEVNNCYERAFELLDLTISLTTRKNLLKELLRFREIFALQYLNAKNPEDIQKNFMQNQKLFNVLLSLNKVAQASSPVIITNNKV
ncbi:MAG: hypothetical protein ISS28_02020 [Candidatus Cloacimonetes bacterium]|nr:hypothetical protein [Candidatus Cloacimonadota bacterium]MBL7085865.1 hypothetical protein [Candidatus Cloacimonadota bacterium]